MRDHQDGLIAVAVNAQKFLIESLACERVEGAERLVHQQQVRLLQQGAREGNALGHAAGELRRVGVGERFQPHQRKGRVGPLAVVRIERLLEFEGQQDIFQGCAPGHQIGILEDESDLRLGSLHGAASELHLA